MRAAISFSKSWARAALKLSPEDTTHVLWVYEVQSKVPSPFCGFLSVPSVYISVPLLETGLRCFPVPPFLVLLPFVPLAMFCLSVVICFSRPIAAWRSMAIISAVCPPLPSTMSRCVGLPRFRGVGRGRRDGWIVRMRRVMIVPRVIKMVTRIRKASISSMVTVLRSRTESWELEDGLE